MYNFIDVTETQEGISLPSEALCLNGEYIENLIPGYRTLTVEGREALSPELSSFETGLRDGSTKKGKRYPARIIRVTYQLIAESAAAFREAFNKLGGILDVEDAMLIFNDESDKYFTGTPSYIGEVPSGRNAVIGEFEITCLDPFKYSLMEYEAEAARGESSVLIDYQGTYKSFPTLQANLCTEDEASEDGESVVALTGNGDCGYVAFFNEKEKIIQIGDPDEVDGEELAKSQTLINQDFTKVTSWGSAAKALWTVNSGITSSPVVVQTGSLNMGVASTSQNTNPATVKTVVFDTYSTEGEPTICYKITAHASHRTDKLVKVTFTIDTWLKNTNSYFGYGYDLQAKLSVQGKVQNITLKRKDQYWRGQSKHTKTCTVHLDVDSTVTIITNPGTFEAYRTDGTGGTAGVIRKAIKDISLPVYFTPSPLSYYLTADSYGTGSNWHGASITRRIPADSSGYTGAKNFTLSWRQKMSIAEDGGGTSQLGAFQVLLVSGSGASRKIVAGVNVYKGTNGTKAKTRYYVNNTVVMTKDVDISSNNEIFQDYNTFSVKKFGGKVTFHAGGYGGTFIDNVIANVEVTEVTFTFTQFGTKPPLEYNGLYQVKFVKENCDTWKNVKNKFGANDVIEADCNTGTILLNGVETPALGALGNDWEELYLTPGINQIGFAYSEWVDPDFAPTFKVRYREVFL